MIATRQRRPMLAALLVAILCCSFAMPGLSLAAGTLDQSQIAQTSSSTNVTAIFWAGQTFRAGRTGALDKVEVLVKRNGATTSNLLVHLYTLHHDGLPEEEALATATVQSSGVPTDAPVLKAATFQSPPQVSAGESYALILSVASGLTESYAWYASPNNPYANGARVENDNGGDFEGWDFSAGTSDYVFQTYVDSSNSFSDVPPSHPYSEDIQEIRELGLILGYTADGCARRQTAFPCFGPDEHIARSEVPVFFTRWADFSDVATCPQPQRPDFADIAGLATELVTAIQTLADHCLVVGYNDVEYGPNDTISELQVVLIISRIMVAKGHWTILNDNPDYYSNIPTDEAIRRYIVTYVENAGEIAYLDEQGVLKEYSTNGPWSSAHHAASRAWTAHTILHAIHHATQSAP